MLKIIFTSLILVLPAYAGGDTPPTPLPQTVEQKIEIAFGEDAEIMKKIAICESGMRQFREDGTTLISPTNDSGIFQVNNFAHKETANKLGIDYNTEDGNISYAKYLFERSGTQPWYMSKHCWNK